jgi:hypothetical protein
VRDERREEEDARAAVSAREKAQRKMLSVCTCPDAIRRDRG